MLTHWSGPKFGFLLPPFCGADPRLQLVTTDLERVDCPDCLQKAGLPRPDSSAIAACVDGHSECGNRWVTAEQINEALSLSPEFYCLEEPVQVREAIENGY